MMGKWADRLHEAERERRMSQDLESAKAWLTVLRQQGFTLWREGDKILLKPWSQLGEERASILRDLKPQLLTLLYLENV